MGVIDQQTIDYTLHPRVNSSDPVPPRPRPETPAHIIATDEEAIAIAERLAGEFAVGAALRDREGLLPLAEIDAYSQSGLWSINVPKTYGGPGVSYKTLARVIAILAAADPSIAQITQNHLAINGHIDLDGTEEQKKEFFGWVLSGLRFGNAFSELSSKTVAAFETRVAYDGDHAVVNGEKFYTTGALLSHIIPIVAVDEEGKGFLVFTDRNAPGITVTNNWSSFGQRTTASGSVKIENVRVHRSRLLPVAAFDRPTVAGPVSQIIQAAVDVGIARGAIEETIAFVKTQSRPWIDSGKETAGEDPFTIAAIGDLKIKLHAAEALLGIAGEAIDRGLKNPTEEAIADATIKTAEAKVLTTEIAILATNKLFELAGTRSTLAKHNLDRHWRNARAHTLHDPVRWKFFHVGNFYLNDINPPRHPWS
ncbi:MULTISPECIES: SfnB family sulfur acquisition oxidoreductase [unclassified Rhizobium]|uniref:SfnB family sulfur acquisition oxidoreductase n=1 Tax=unclassified Rhizobium TaxID=2613769 RepID=UPI000716108C|nr:MULTISPECIES: SfnB family sulfur acquisition oxidoreductase [unclassified Rhizobium]KQS89467.1 SfnB family sulfur acquisition oxidoreductase [Rhizobium sp. Leaf391]KQS94746.1 SfnB family sulfur acquisition oxidoreductase [Rhizobium sp. Leaf386]KQU01124.1 SfnB family sulfur acquisition oxidoreductase [Rhizobium sp. Leaf453]